MRFTTDRESMATRPHQDQMLALLGGPLRKGCIPGGRNALSGSKKAAGEIPSPHLKVTVGDHQNNPFGIQWQRYWDDAPYPDLVKTVPHVAFEVGDLAEAIRDQKVIIAPNSPSTGVLVAMIEVNGAPEELMQIDHLVRKDL